MHGTAVKLDQASTAGAHLAAGMRTRQLERIAQAIDQRLARRNFAGDLAAVDDEANPHGLVGGIQQGLVKAAHAPSPRRPSRRPNSTRARCSRIAGGTSSLSGGARSLSSAVWAAAMRS